jgi:short-subunit dehydrogenase
MSKVILVTGISSGIGFATADFYLKRGHTVVGTFRKAADAEYFEKNFSNNFIGIQCDVTDFAKVDQIPQLLREKNISSIDALVNNAGIALAGPIEYQAISEIQNIIQVNVMSVIKMTQVILPFLKKSSDGRIVNISSVAGRAGTPFLAAYCASKHAIEGFSEALRREMFRYGIKVSIVAPGSIKTPIWSKGFAVVAKLYEKTEFKDSFYIFTRIAASEEKHGLSVEAVVRDIDDAIMSSNPCLRYAPIPRKFQNWYLPKIIPQKIYDKLTARVLSLNKK